MKGLIATLLLLLVACSCATKQATQTATITVTVSGWVKTPGTYKLPQGATPIAALEAAGGFRDYAHSPKLTIIRKEAGQEKLFSVRVRNQAGRPTADFELMDGDTVVAHEHWF